MKTILSILIMFYLIVVVFIIIEKKIKNATSSKPKKLVQMIMQRHIKAVEIGWIIQPI